ncbi:MAG: class I SAM-dependent DNA methyltransferase, partial [Caulobacter sp.]|nr:class I SAM-dependent DNA methyltransferase [Caulobacter sp.]
VAHFLNRIVFCMFAEDAKLLPEGLFTRLTKSMQMRPPAEAAPQFDALFAMMRGGGMFGADIVHWFNGGLFDDKPALPLERADIKLIHDTAAEHDWSDLDPSVFGNMFEEALKATRERAALGAHYTDREKILKIIDPVITWPLMAEWETALAEIRAALDARAAAEAERKAVQEAAAEAMRADPVKAKAGEAARRKTLTAIAKRADAALGQAKDRLETFLARLAAFRVLDPACGSGNFLYVALHTLKDIERRALVDAERLGLEVPTPRVGLACVRGIEIEEYAAELARVTLWIGDLQWHAKNNYRGFAEPILSSLDQIECRDALLNPDGTEAQWPAVDVIVGNPPFVGRKLLRSGLGDAYVDQLFETYSGQVPAEADLVTYWVAKSWLQIQKSQLLRAGLVTTNSIRTGPNRTVVDRVADVDALMVAWSDEPWALEGAAVRVSMVAFGSGFTSRCLNGHMVARLNSDLTSDGISIAHAQKLNENKARSFIGIQKNGKFDIDGDKARQWLRSPRNVNGRPNSEVLRPLLSG